MKRSTLFLSIGGAALLALAAWHFSGPYRLADRLAQAARSDDTLALLEAVDRSATEASVTRRLEAQARQSLAQGRLDHPVLVMGESMVPLMAQRLAGEIASPEGVAAIVLKAGEDGARVRPAGLGEFTLQFGDQGSPVLVAGWQRGHWKVIDVRQARY